jgi:septal ring factor EnvC (AmiA/AmiB activator)
MLPPSILTPQSPSRPRPAIPFLLLCGLVVQPLAAQSPDTTERTAERIATVRESLDKYVETSRILAQTRADWRSGKEQLEDRITLARRELQKLKETIGKAEASVTDADRSRAELEQENSELLTDAQLLQERVGRYEDLARGLVTRLPATLQKTVRPLSQRLPQQGKPTDLPLGQRYLTVIGILNEVNRFQNEITVVPEVRQLTAELEAEVSTVYLGLGQALYATDSGEHSGRGMARDASAGQPGWVWEPLVGTAGEIRRVVRTLTAGELTAFVPVPVRIK